MTDRLDMDALNALPGPLMVRFCGDDWLWPVFDIEVQTGLMRIDVCGRLQVKEFCEVMALYDDSGCEHDADQFWLDD